MFSRAIRTSLAVFLLVQLMATLIVNTDGATDEPSSLSDETVYKDLIAGKRQILALGKVSENYILLVADKLNNLDDAYVYEIPNDGTLSKLPLSGGSLVRSKWPLLQQHLSRDVSSVFFIRDSTNNYVMVFYNGSKPFAFNIHKEDGFYMNDLVGDIEPMMSAYARLTSYSFNYEESSFYATRYNYTGKSFDVDHTKMQETNETFYVCQDEKDKKQVAFQEKKCNSNNSLEWFIQNGFIDQTKTTLFSKSGMIYQIPTFTSKNLGKAMNVKRFKMKEFFDISGKDFDSSDNTDQDDSNGDRKNTSSKRPFLTKGIKTGLIVGIVFFVIFLILVLVIASICCFRKPKNKIKKAKASKTRKMTGKDRKGNKSRRNVCSRRSSARKSSRCTPKASSVANSRAALCSRRTTAKSSRRMSQATSNANSQALHSRRTTGKSFLVTSQGGQRVSSRKMAQSGHRSRRSIGPTSSMAKSTRRVLSQRMSTSRVHTQMPTTRQSTSRLSSKRRISIKTQAMCRAKSSHRNNRRSSVKPY